MKAASAIVRPDGTIEYIGHALNMDALGRVKLRRASYIEPKSRIKRSAFLMLRWAFGEVGRVSEWTRSWKCVWTVRWASEPSVIVFENPDRATCIVWEIEQLEAKGFE